MKKFIFIFFALILPLMASAYDFERYNTKVNGVYYKFNTAELTASVSYKAFFRSYFAEERDVVEFEIISNDYSGDVVIPKEVTYNNITYTVTSIDNHAFRKGFIYDGFAGKLTGSGCIDMTSVTIPNSVTSIGECAFGGCSGLIYVILPENLESIDQNAFKGCDGLTDLYCYSETVPSAYENTFYNPENIILHVPEESLKHTEQQSLGINLRIMCH